MKKRDLSFLILAIFLLSIVSAGFEVSNVSHSIQSSYAPGEAIKGWINISLTDEPANYILEDSFGSTISLIDLLKKNNQTNYNCNTLNCVSDYKAINGESEKLLSLNNRETALMGLKFSGDIVNVNSIDFNIQSDAPESCANQLKIDFFDDRLIDAGNAKSADRTCEKSYGCYDSNPENQENYNLGSVSYCQKIKLTESPGFRIGAWVKNVSGSKNIFMEIYDMDGNSKGSCSLPEIASEGEFSCDVDYPAAESEDYFVCIYSPEEQGEYQIKGNPEPAQGCGFYGIPVQTETPGSYKIFALGKKFDAVGELEVPEYLTGDKTISELIMGYLTANYGLDCSDGCAVPVRLIAGENQQLTFSDLNLRYEKTSGQVTENKFYDLTEIPAVINADFQKIYLDNAGFYAPSDLGNFSFKLKLNDNEIFSQEIFAEKAPEIKTLSPMTAASAFPAEFEVRVDSLQKIAEYKWDFGDNTTKVTSENKVPHTYNSQGEYNLKITVTDSNQRSSFKIFNITVGSPEVIINATLNKVQKDFENIKLQLQSFDPFTKDKLNSVLEVDSVNEKLKELQKKFRSAGEEDYNEIISGLQELKVPKSVAKSTGANLIPFFPDTGSINLRILQLVGGENFEGNLKNEYVNSILLWNQENIETKVTFSEYSAGYEDFEEPILRIFTINLDEKTELPYNYYLILRKLSNLEFKEDYLQREESGYVYIELTEQSGQFIFSTTEDVDFTDLPVFISPDLSRLSLSSGQPVIEPKEDFRFLIFGLLIVLLLFFGIASYIAVQEWYKKKYRDYLFKDKNHFYNMINYVNNAKTEGLKNKEIVKELKKAGWNSEQIAYIMKSYSGKRTGMIELPFGRFFRKKVLAKPVQPPKAVGQPKSPPRAVSQPKLRGVSKFSEMKGKKSFLRKIKDNRGFSF